jgi:hypothetical protein
MNKIIEVKFGSHLYGTDTPNSDLDLKAIYLPTAEEICLHSYKKTITTSRPKQQYERNHKDDVDIEIFSLDRFLELLVQGQTVALDFLFADGDRSYTFSTGIGLVIMDQLYENRKEFLNKNINAFVGYAKQQAAKYGQKGFRVHALRESLTWLSKYPENAKLEHIEEVAIQHWIDKTKNEHILITMCKGPNGILTPHLEICDKKYPIHATVKYVKQQVQRRFDEYGQRALKAEKNEGVDWKALSHAVRVNNQAQELLETGHITFPRPDRELLLAIKTGQMDYKEVAELIENGLVQLEASKQKSTLRESPNVDWVNDFVYSIYSEIVKGGL